MISSSLPDDPNRNIFCAGLHDDRVKQHLCYWQDGDLICHSCGMIVEGKNKGIKLKQWVSIFGTLAGKW